MIEKSLPHVITRLANPQPAAGCKIHRCHEGQEEYGYFAHRNAILATPIVLLSAGVKDSKASRDLLERGLGHLWRYEDFIESPQDSLDELCDFIGVSRSEEIVELSQTCSVGSGQEESQPMRT